MSEKISLDSSVFVIVFTKSKINWTAGTRYYGFVMNWNNSVISLFCLRSNCRSRSVARRGGLP